MRRPVSARSGYGFLYVPAHTYNPETTKHQRKKPNSRATYAAKRGAKTDRPQWSRHEAEAYGAHISEDIDAASSWEDLQSLFARDGYILEPEASGWVVGNARGYAELSALGLQRSAKTKPRFPAPAIIDALKPGRPHRHIPLVDAVDIAKGLAACGLISRDEVRATISESIEARQERRRRKQSSDMLDKLIKMHPLAESSLTPPRPRTQRPAAQDDPAASLSDRECPAHQAHHFTAYLTQECHPNSVGPIHCRNAEEAAASPRTLPTTRDCINLDTHVIQNVRFSRLSNSNTVPNTVPDT